MEPSGQEELSAVLTPVFLAGPMRSGKDTVAQILEDDYGYVVVGLADALKRDTAWLFDFDDRAFWGTFEEKAAPLAEPLDEGAIYAVATSDTYFSKWAHLWIDRFHERVPFPRVSEQLRAALLPVAPITTPRVLLQRMGTEFGRALWEDVWVEEVARTQAKIAEGRVYFRRDGVLSHLRTRRSPAPIVVPDVRFLSEARYAVEKLSAPVFWIDAEKRVPRDPRFAHASEPVIGDLGPYVTDVINNNGTQEALRGEVRRVMALHVPERTP